MTTGTEPAVEIIDLAQTPLRELNARLHARAPTSRRRPQRWRVTTPAARHAIAVGLDAPVRGRGRGPRRLLLRRHEPAGRGPRARQRRRRRGREHHVGLGHGRAATPASRPARPARGGLLVIEGDASSRCGISMKGVDIVVRGSVGHMSAFMAQKGRLRRLRRRRRRARRLDLRGAALRARHGRRPRRRLRREGAARASTAPSLARCSSAAGIDDADPGEFRRYGSARGLYNFHVDHAGEY